MSRTPSTETQLRTTKSLNRKLNTALGNAQRERDFYRARATKAEQECAEWKLRFDALLALKPTHPKIPPRSANGLEPQGGPL